MEFSQGNEALKANGVDVRRLTLYKPNSSGLAKLHVRAVPAATLEALQQTDFFIDYQDSDARYLRWRKNLLPHRKTRQTS